MLINFWLKLDCIATSFCILHPYVGYSYVVADISNVYVFVLEYI
jgi:hypothetical protein